jgi:AcrR family transcriptional regulator
VAIQRIVATSDIVTDVEVDRREQRRLQHQDLSRAQLLDAAEQIFGRKGFHEATLKEVAELAGFSVGSVYSFFENKDALFRHVYLRRADQFMPALRSAIGSDAPALAVLHDVVTFQVQFFRDHPHFGRLYLFHSGHAFSADAEPPLDPAILANFAEAMELQSGLFARGQRDGVLRQGDPAVLSRLFSGLVAAYQEMDPAITSDDPAAASTERLPLADLHNLVGRAFAA